VCPLLGKRGFPTLGTPSGSEKKEKRRFNGELGKDSQFISLILKEEGGGKNFSILNIGKGKLSFCQFEKRRWGKKETILLPLWRSEQGGCSSEKRKKGLLGE